MRGYFDYASTSPVRPAVKEAVEPFIGTFFGNPSALSKEGQEARFAVEEARRKIASGVGAKASEITFTSGGTEANNWALTAALEMGFSEGRRHIITTAIEHPSVLKTCQWLEKLGASLTILPAKSNGTVSLQDVADAIRPDTLLCSVMWVNNELGSILPMEEIGLFCHDNSILFHVDAVQALSAISIDVSTLPVDFMSFSAHKIGGLKGTGALYIREGLELPSYLHGGAQERGKRAGTENVPGIVAFGKAVEEVQNAGSTHGKKMNSFREQIISNFENISGVTLNVRENTIPSILNFRVEGIQNEDLLTCADMAGLSLSAGSACSSGSLEPSPVLLAIGLSPEVARTSFRLSMGYGTTEEEVGFLVETFPEIIARLRK